LQKAEYEVADCYYKLGQEKEAVSRFKLLRAKYPDSKLTPEIMWWLGQYYYRLNDLNLARRYLSSLAKDFPDNALSGMLYMPWVWFPGMRINLNRRLMILE